MVAPTRRRLLRAGAALASGVLGGCADRRGDATATPQPTTDDPSGTATPSPETLPPGSYDALAWDGAPALRTLDAAARRSVGPYFLAVLASRRQARTLRSRLRDAAPAALLENTDFGRSVAVLLQDAAGQSHPDLAVRAVRRGEGYLELDAAYPGQGGTADTRTDSLLVRVPRGGAAPTHATAALERLAGPTVRFSTVGRHGRPRLPEPRDVAVRNRDCEPAALDVSATVDGELVYAPVRDGPVAPGETVRDRDALGAVAEYRLRAERAGGGAVTDTVAFAPEGKPLGALVTLGGDGALSVRTVPETGLPEAGGGDCSAGGLPYESSDPAGNLDRPGRVVWRNRSARDRRLRVTAREAGTVVLDRRLALPAGGKGRTRGLLAKRGVYRTTLTPEDGRERTVDWHVEPPDPDLTLLVGADGGLAVGAASQR